MITQISNGKCNKFVNGNCSFYCPNAALELEADYFDIDISDLGGFIECEDCFYFDDNCDCSDCYMQYNKEYCPKFSKGK